MGKKKRVPSHHFEKKDGKEQLIFRKLIQSQKVTLMVRKMNLPYFFFFSELPPEQKKKKKKRWNNAQHASPSKQTGVIYFLKIRISSVRNETKSGYQVTPSQPENSINLRHLISLAHYLIRVLLKWVRMNPLIFQLAFLMSCKYSPNVIFCNRANHKNIINQQHHSTHGIGMSKWTTLCIQVGLGPFISFHFHVLCGTMWTNSGNYCSAHISFFVKGCRCFLLLNICPRLWDIDM